MLKRSNSARGRNPGCASFAPIVVEVPVGGLRFERYLDAEHFREHIVQPQARTVCRETNESCLRRCARPRADPRVEGPRREPTPSASRSRPWL